ncbi:MAG: hypothetical protein ACRCZ2_05220 [Fusobacteriaceae bacterium]
MTKIRIAHRFAQTPNELLNDPIISLKAKGLYGYMQSKPEDWDFSINGLAHELMEGAKAIRAGIKELEIAGWLTRDNYQNSKGQWECDYELQIIKVENNQPLSSKPHSLFGHTQKPHADDGHTQNGHANKERITKQETKKEYQLKKGDKFNAETYIQSLDIDPEIISLLIDWLEIRKVKKTATTQKAIDLALKDLNKHDINTQKTMIENSIKGGYTGIFELKPYRTQTNKPFVKFQTNSQRAVEATRQDLHDPTKNIDKLPF